MSNETTQVGNVISNPPRAVKVRVPGQTESGANDMVPHSAVVANITILTDNLEKARELLDRWPDIIRAIDNELVDETE